MKEILKHLLIALLLVSLILPFAPYPAASSSLTQNEMRSITGGYVAIDCSALASVTEAFCYLCGGGPVTCSTIYVTTYLGCALAKILF